MSIAIPFIDSIIEKLVLCEYGLKNVLPYTNWHYQFRVLWALETFNVKFSWKFIKNIILGLINRFLIFLFRFGYS